MFGKDVQQLFETLQGSGLGIIAMVSTFIVILIPLIALIVVGASLLTKRNYFTVQKSVTLGVLWIVAAVLAGTTGALQAEQIIHQSGGAEVSFDDSSFEIEWEGLK